MFDQGNLSAAERVQTISAKLRHADLLIADALHLLGRGGVEAVSGLPAEMVLSLEARRMGSESRFMMHAADVLRQMRCLSALFAEGVVSWGQVRCIVGAVTKVTVADRDEIDMLIGDRARSMVQADPERLVEFVDDEVDHRRADLALKREDRLIESSFDQRCRFCQRAAAKWC